MKANLNSPIKLESHHLYKYFKDLKFWIFNISNLLLRDESPTQRFPILFSIFEVMQTMVFQFHPQVKFYKYYFLFDKLNSLWNFDKLTYYISIFLQYIGYVPKISWSVHILIFYSCFTFVISILIGLIYLNHNILKTQKFFTKTIFVLKNFLIIFSTILYLPILNIFILVLDCTRDKNGILRHTYFDEIICWEQDHILHSILGIIISFIFTTMVLISSLLIFETKMNSYDLNSK